MHGLIFVVRVVGVDEGERPEIAGQAAPVTQRRAGIDAQVPVRIGIALRVESPELIARGVSQHIAQPVTADGRIGNQHRGLALQIGNAVHPCEQFGGVCLGGIVVRVGRVVERRSRQGGILTRTAERVVILAAARARRLGRVCHPHSGPQRRVGNDPDAAVRAAVAAKRQKQALGENGGYRDISPAAGPGKAQVVESFAAAKAGERSLQASGHPPGARIAPVRSRRIAVAEGPAPPVPVFAAQALGAKVAAEFLVGTEGHPVGMVRSDLHDAAMQQGKRGMGGLRLPLGHDRVRPQRFEVVVGTCPHGTVQFSKYSRERHFLDQVVEWLVIENAVVGIDRRVFRVTVQFVAHGIGPAAPLDRLERVDDLFPGRGRGVDAFRKPEITGIADTGPAGPPGIHQWTQRPVAVLRFQLAPPLMFDGNYEVGFAHRGAPDHSRHLVAGALVAVVGSNDFQPHEVAAGNEIGDAAHRVRAIDGAGALLQHFDTPDGDGRENAQVHEPPADQPRGQIGLPAPVEQDQRPRCAQAPQVDVGNAFQDRCRQTGVVPARALPHDAVAGAQVLEQVHHQRGALLLQGFAVNHAYRVRRVDRRATDRGADHHDLVDRSGCFVGFLSHCRQLRAQ